jgi:hypothetical protein
MLPFLPQHHNQNSSGASLKKETNKETTTLRVKPRSAHPHTARSFLIGALALGLISTGLLTGCGQSATPTAVNNAQTASVPTTTPAASAAPTQVALATPMVGMPTAAASATSSRTWTRREPEPRTSCGRSMPA